jgi:hypothetical protein
MSAWRPAGLIGERPRVFRVMTLEPLALGHLRVLAELGIDPFDSIGVTEAVGIAFVCAQKPDVALRRAEAFWLPAYLRLVLWLTREDDLPKQLAAVREYLEANLQGPEFERDLSRQRRNGKLAAPLQVNLRALAMSRLHLSSAEADAMPVIEALQLLAAEAEASGTVKLWSDEDEAFEQFCRGLENPTANQPEPQRN